ncbi:MAG TPA: LacI family DNA-binding transcriptional regulator [Streptosporangiaceae bacterium]
MAAIAGTSVPTVSKVLRGGTDVSPQMRLKVMDAVRTVGYTRRGRSAGERLRDKPDAPSTIEVVVNHVEGTWMNRVLVGVEYEAAAAGLDVVITLARENHDWTSRLLRRHSAGAVVVLVDPSSSQFKALSAAGIPVVLIDPMSRPPDGTVSVGVANWDGGRIAAEHLLSLGHTRIGIVAGDRRHLYSRARVDGFRAAAEAPVPSEAVISVAHGNWDPEKAEAVTHSLFDRDPAITAVFACSDTMALGVYDALAARDLRVPADVSVVGFDDRPEAQWARPPLTTVRQPTAELGATAVKRLLELARTDRNELRSRSRLELSTDLVIRASTSQPELTPVRSEDLRAHGRTGGGSSIRTCLAVRPGGIRNISESWAPLPA